MESKKLQLLILRHIESAGECEFQSFADKNGCTAGEVQDAAYAALNRGFIKAGYTFNERFEKAVVMPAGLDYIKENTVRTPPLRLRISDFFWHDILGRSAAMVIGLLAGYIGGYMHASVTIEKTYQHKQYENQIIEPLRQVPSPVVPTGNAANQHQNNNE